MNVNETIADLESRREQNDPKKPVGKFPKLHHAISMATLWHNGQDRKYSGVPYIVHPLRVMSIVRTVTDDEAMLCAAVLHDIVEDTNVTIDLINTYFGYQVAELVGWLTDVSKPEDGNRLARKNIDLNHTAMASADAQTIKLADLIDNAASITGNDPNFAVVFMKEKERLLKVLTKGDKALHNRATLLLQNYQNELLQEALNRG